MADDNSTRDLAGLDAAELVAMSVPREAAVSGVYFLILGGAVQYVGKSVNVPARLRQHERRGRAFDRYALIPCDDPLMSHLEVLYIHRLQPPWNGSTGKWAMAARFDPTEEAMRSAVEKIGRAK